MSRIFSHGELQSHITRVSQRLHIEQVWFFKAWGKSLGFWETGPIDVEKDCYFSINPLRLFTGDILKLFRNNLQKPEGFLENLTFSKAFISAVKWKSFHSWNLRPLLDILASALDMAENNTFADTFNLIVFWLFLKSWTLYSNRGSWVQTYKYMCVHEFRQDTET